jgi:DNA repair protein RecO (recombination protein O)
MISRTRGIVFRFTKFRETSIIVTIFTEEFGLQSYIVNGVRSKSAKNKIALYQPLTLLNLVVYHRENVNIERIREISCIHPYRTVATDVRKATLAMFITEILNKTVKEESHAGEIFQFIFDSLVTLDNLESGYENFHLIFLLKLARYLGFGAQMVNEVIGGRVADREGENIIGELLAAEYETHLHITNMQRRNALDLIVKFYHEHMDTLGEIKSLQVLREVFM